jgi:hypothetical protein
LCHGLFTYLGHIFLDFFLIFLDLLNR